MRVALKIAYDGRTFHGFARQPNVRTVEEDILQVFCTQKIISNSQESGFRVASRTDKGVSALGNVIAFNTQSSKEEILSSLQNISEDIISYGFTEVPNDFYPRHAQNRHYRYYLKKQTEYKKKTINSILNLFIGEHNFQNFARVESFRNPIRTIQNIQLSETSTFFIIDISAQTFLWHQIRRMISALLKVLQGKKSYQQIKYALDHPKIPMDFGISSAEPLILMDVVYQFSFSIDNAQYTKSKEIEQKIIQSPLIKDEK